jgi:hypothetical protein
MQKIKINGIEVNRLELMKIWDGHNVITRNLDNIIKDFDFMNQNTEYEVTEITDEVVVGLTNEKMKYLNAHICGILCTTSPDSNYNKNHVICEDEINAKKIEKTNDFAKSLQL